MEYSIFIVNRVGRGLESPNPNPLVLGNETKPRKVLYLQINSLIARQWLNQDRKQASRFPGQDYFYHSHVLMPCEIVL